MLIFKKKKLIYKIHSDSGDCRTINEDSCFAASERFGKHCAGIFAVADGCGGMQRGDEASKLAVEAVQKAWKRILDSEFDVFSYFRFSPEIIGEFLEDIVQEAQISVTEMGRIYDCDPASTLTILFIVDNYYWIKHVGDSRIYLMRNGLMECITKDQTVLADMLRNGEISPFDIEKYNRSILSMSIGIKGKVHTFSGHRKIRNNDIFLICSDGFYAYADEEEIFMALKERKNDLQSLRNLIKTGNAADNVTFIVVWQKRD